MVFRPTSSGFNIEESALVFDRIVAYNITDVKFSSVTLTVRKDVFQMSKQLPIEAFTLTEIGGVGEMIYRAARFPEYVYEYDPMEMEDVIVSGSICCLKSD